MTKYPLEPIGVIHSPFREKFATPRQAGLAPSVLARIELYPEFAPLESVRGLEEFSHIWLLFLFHHHWQQGWKAMVRPPRLGGNRRVGVYASRAPFRPNPIGLSAVELLQIDQQADTLSLQVRGADLVDQTPLLDIKPYLPYGDCLPTAHGGFAKTTPDARLTVEFVPSAAAVLESVRPRVPDLEQNLREILSLDPRPAYRWNDSDPQEYGFSFGGYNVRWRVTGQRAEVLKIEPEAEQKD